MTSEKKTLRRYGAAKKAQVLTECTEPGKSVAKVFVHDGIGVWLAARGAHAHR